MKTSTVLCLLWAALPCAAAQFEGRAQPEGRAPWVRTFIPSAAGGARGLAVGVLPPLAPRYADGAPVVVFVPGGADKGAAEGLPSHAGFGFVEVRFAFPGGGRGEWTSGGTYDHRGPDCIRALADVIKFASGKSADKDGRRIGDLIPRTKVLTAITGIEGSSHGGNACGLAMATHGAEFRDLAFYASMESPYSEGAVNVELGARDDRLNPAYNPETGALDFAKLAWDPNLQPGPAKRWRGAGSGLKGALFFDLDGDGKFSEQADFPVNAFSFDDGAHVKIWYTPRLIRAADARKLSGEPRPAHLPTLAEALEFRRWRDAQNSITNAVRNCTNLAVIVYANERDHVQIAPDHPHILAQVEGYRTAGAKFVRLNADRAYVARVAANFPRERTAGLKFPDNDAGVEWTRKNIRTALEPAELPLNLYMAAVVCELADRVHAQAWSKNLGGLLYPNAPWILPLPNRAGGNQRPPHAPDRPQRPG